MPFSSQKKKNKAKREMGKLSIFSLPKKVSEQARQSD